MFMWCFLEWFNFWYCCDILVVDYVWLVKGDGGFRFIVGDVINVIFIVRKKGIWIESVERFVFFWIFWGVFGFWFYIGWVSNF